MDVGVNKALKERWQDRLAASEWAPVPGSRSAAHGNARS